MVGRQLGADAGLVSWRVCIYWCGCRVLTLPVLLRYGIGESEEESAGESF